MSRLSDFIRSKNQSLQKEFISSVEKDINDLTEQSFREGKLTSKTFVQSLQKIYLDKINSFLNSLYTQCSEYIANNDGSFVAFEEELAEELQYYGDELFEKFQKKFLEYNQGAQEDPELFKEMSAESKKRYKAFQQKIKNQIEKKVFQEEQKLKQQQKGKLYVYLSKYGKWLLVCAVFLLLFLIFSRKDPSIEREYRTAAKNAEKLLRENRTNETLKLYEELLEKVSPAKNKQVYGKIKGEQGKVYFKNLKAAKSSSNSKLAINALQEAARVLSEKENPRDFASAHANLGGVHLFMPEIQFWGDSLSAILKKNMRVPKSQRKTIVSLNDSFALLDKDANLENAEKAFKESLNVYTKKDFPVEHSLIQANLGSVFYKRAHSNSTKQNLEKALKHYEEALATFNTAEYPVHHALLQNGLSVIYFKLSEFGQRESLYNQALEASQRALKILISEGESDLLHQVRLNTLEIQRHVQANQVFMSPMMTEQQKLISLQRVNREYELAIQNQVKLGKKKKE